MCYVIGKINMPSIGRVVVFPYFNLLLIIKLPIHSSGGHTTVYSIACTYRAAASHNT